MPQFDVLRVRSTGEAVIDCQSDLLRDLPTRFVIPLFPLDSGLPVAGRLNPTLRVGDDKLVLGTQYALSIPLSELSGAIASLERDRIEIIGALDVLISGV